MFESQSPKRTNIQQLTDFQELETKHVADFIRILPRPVKENIGPHRMGLDGTGQRLR